MSGDISAQAGTIDYYTTQGDPSSKVSVNEINNPVYQSVGAYAEGTLKVHDRVRLLLGMRIDKDERYDQISRSPRAALIVNPRSDLALKAIYTEAFIAPAPFYMFDVYVPWWINTVNLNLKPERARSFELNAEFRRENVLASVSGYYNTQRNLLLAGGTVSDAIMVNPAVYLSPDPAALPLSLQHDANGGNNVAYGGDFFGRVSMARNRATLWGSYGYVDSQMKNTKDGVEVKVGLPGLAHHNLRLGATFAILRDQLFANLSLWLRSSPQSLDQLGNMMVTPTTIAGTADRPYEVSLNLIYRIKAGFEAFTTLKNITNHRYATVYEATYSPGELFRGIAGLRFRN
jgi:outer membrane receptor protein involved in Fe transport